LSLVFCSEFFCIHYPQLLWNTQLKRPAEKSNGARKFTVALSV
jgi:hypothetical protein